MSGHRSTLKQINKPHKSGHSAKNPHKVFKPAAPVASILPVKGQKERRLQEREAHRKSQYNPFAELGTRHGPPKVVGFMPCSPNADPQQFLSHFNFIPEESTQQMKWPSGIIAGGQFACRIIPIPIKKDISYLIATNKAVDMIVLIFNYGEDIDSWVPPAVSILKATGLPTLLAAVYSPSGTPIPPKDINNFKRRLQSDLPSLDRVLPVSSPDEAIQFIRFLQVTTPDNLPWRSSRPYMLIQDLNINGTRCTISGYLRGAPLCLSQLITIPGVGDFRINSCNDLVPDPETLHPSTYFIPTALDPNDVNNGITPLTSSPNLADQFASIHVVNDQETETFEDFGEEVLKMNQKMKQFYPVVKKI